MSRTALADVLDGSAFLTMSNCPTAKDRKRFWSNIIDERRLSQHHPERRFEFVSGVNDRPRQGDHRDVLYRSGTLQGRRGFAARETLLSVL